VSEDGKFGSWRREGRRKNVERDREDFESSRGTVCASHGREEGDGHGVGDTELSTFERRRSIQSAGISLCEES